MFIVLFSIFGFYIPTDSITGSPYKVIRQLQSLWLIVQFTELFVSLMVTSSLVNRLLEKEAVTEIQPPNQVVFDLTDPLIAKVNDRQPDRLPSPPPEMPVLVEVLPPIHLPPNPITVAPNEMNAPIAVLPIHQHIIGEPSEEPSGEPNQSSQAVPQ